MTDKNNKGLVPAPIIFKEIGGTLYAVYGYFSPGARETAREKIGRLLTKEAERKSGESPGITGLSGGRVV